MPDVPSILVLDDEPALTKLVSLVLEARGYLVRGFTRPLEALEALEDFVPDAIISDVSMPQMDGLAFCRRVRENPRFTNVPFIFLSAMAERRDVREGMNVGADDYLTKPFQSEELLDALEVRLKRAETLRAPNAPSSASVVPMDSMQARALGAASLWYRGGEVSWGSRKAAEFFFLLLERPNGVTTWEAAEALWPEKDEARAASVFHTTLHRLRKVMDEELVYTRNRRYYLNGELSLRYDVREYLELVQQAQRSMDLEVFEKAVQLYHGAYLADFESSWCQDLRETLHGTHLSLLLDASRRAETLGDARRATWFAHLSTQHDPYSDQTWGELSRLYDGMGDNVRAERARARLEAWD
jgi:two-component SAPR family response regulator